VGGFRLFDFKAYGKKRHDEGAGGEGGVFGVWKGSRTSLDERLKTIQR